MKRLTLLFAALVAVLASNSAFAADLTSEQLRMRNSIQNFLKEEGFSPYIDTEDQSVDFKKEGTLYWITFSGSGALYLEFHRAGLDCEDANSTTVLKACNQGNRKTRCAKAMYSGTFVSFAVEMYCRSVEEFKYTFYKYLGELQTIRDEVYDYYNNAEGTPLQDLYQDPSTPFFTDAD